MAKERTNLAAGTESASTKAARRLEFHVPLGDQVQMRLVN